MCGPNGQGTGSEVITTAGSDEKLKLCRELGGDLVLNYKTEDVDAAIKKVAPQGVNVWWETLREPNFERTVALLAMRGRMVVMAGRDEAGVPGGTVLRERLFAAWIRNVQCLLPRSRLLLPKTSTSGWQDGKLKARIDRVLPLSQAAEAHRLQEESTIHKKGTLSGKLVLKI